MKPLLKWAGGKAKLAPRIAEALGGACPDIYWEPFLGAGAVYLYLQSQRLIGEAVLSDTNRGLVNLFQVVQRKPEALITELERLPTYQWRPRYEQIREHFNRGRNESLAYDVDWAALFLWLNKACFNGLYRVNRDGEFNVPPGSYERLSIPEPEHIREVSRLLQPAQLYCEDYQEALVQARAGDQVYCDPPYAPASVTASFTAYTPGGFGQAQQESLAQLARSLGRRGVRTVLSNADVPFVRALYNDFDLAPIEVQRSISCSTRSRVGELIITARTG